MRCYVYFANLLICVIAVSIVRAYFYVCHLNNEHFGTFPYICKANVPLVLSIMVLAKKEKIDISGVKRGKHNINLL